MIKQTTFTKENINRIAATFKVDYELAGRAVFALGLVEALIRVHADFIFKGGSSLMLLFDFPKRLSTDVDILVSPDCDIEKYLFEVSKIFPFKGAKEIIRSSNKKIPKRHFKITYNSTNSDKEYTVLVDVLSANNPYQKVVKKAINNKLLICEGEDYYVSTPSIESILGDKLTAFAPHTIGVKFLSQEYSNDKRLEVIKQFFDVSSLFDIAKDYQSLKKTYFDVANEEIRYRGLDIKANDCLLDTFNSALCILSLGKFMKEDYQDYISGFRKISGHIIGRRLNPNNATIDAAKIMLLTSCLIKNIDPFKIEVVDQELLEDAPFNRINYLHKIDRTAFNYAALAVKILNS